MRYRRTQAEIEAGRTALVRTCTKCLEEKSSDDFRETKHADGKTRQCKVCTNEASELHQRANWERRQHTTRVRNLKNFYGITVEQYEELLEKQNHRCVICSRHADEFKIRLSIDHNHGTGEIRGLLCTYCNHRVIGRHKDGDLLRRMADYVDSGTGLFIPERKPKKRKKKT